MHDTLRDRLRLASQRNASPSAASVDSQTVKTTEACGERGYGGGKKTNGRKRHRVFNTLGLILAVVVHSAAVQAYDGAHLAIARLGK